MKEKDFLAIAKEAAKNTKMVHDLSQLTEMLSKITIEAPSSAKLNITLRTDKQLIQAI